MSTAEHEKLKCYLLYRIQSIVSFCDDFKNDTIQFAFKASDGTITENPFDQYYCWTPRYQQYWVNLHDAVSVCGMLGIKYLDDDQSGMMDCVNWLNNSQTVNSRHFFERHLNYIRENFECVEDQIKEKLNLLNREESDRLNEALRCYLENCYNATVAMSVSAVELRLLGLMTSVSPTAELAELTLGQLIGEYLSNKKKYGSVIPKKHEPLLDLCNQYRIFSVHPKSERITKSIATSIMNMAFAFLLDKELKKKIEATG